MATSRMLLSHNFDLDGETIPALSREEFAAVFIDGFSDRPTIQCHTVDNPHWIIGLKFDPVECTAEHMGQDCAHILRQYRQRQGSGMPSATTVTLPTVLILGGIKITPPISNSPDSLQTGEWGVDVVETANSDRFLHGINWQTTISQKDPTTIFKVVLD
jgi:hypothetical protein